MAACAPICWLTAKRQHCLFNMRRVRGHCIAFVRSVVEVMLSSGPSCCRQLGHATYIESNYPCQLITTQLVPSHNTHKCTHAQYNECTSSCTHTCKFTRRPSRFMEGRNSKSVVDGRPKFKAEQCASQESEKENCFAVSLRPCIFLPLHRVALSF